MITSEAWTPVITLIVSALQLNELSAGYEIRSIQNTRITYFCTTKGTSQAITKTDWLNTLLGMKRWPLTRQHRKWNWWSVHRFPGWGRGGGELSYKSDRNARRLALGCKLQILVSLRVFGMKSYYICPSRYRLVLCVKKFTKKYLTLTRQKSTLGVSLSHTHIGLPALGV